MPSNIYDDLTIEKIGNLIRPILAVPIDFSSVRQRVSPWLWEKCLDRNGMNHIPIPTIFDNTGCLWMGIGARYHGDLIGVLFKNDIEYTLEYKGCIDMFPTDNIALVRFTNISPEGRTAEKYTEEIKMILPRRYSKVVLNPNRWFEGYGEIMERIKNQRN